MDKPNPIKKTKFNLEQAEVNNKNKTTTNANKSTRPSIPFNAFNSFAPSPSTCSNLQNPRPSPSTSCFSSKSKPLKPLPTAPKLTNQAVKPITAPKRTNLNLQTKTLEFGNASDSFLRAESQDLVVSEFEGEEEEITSKKDKGKGREIEPVKKKLGNMNVFNSFGTFNPSSTPTTSLSSKPKSKSISRPPPAPSSSSFKQPSTFTLPLAPPRPSTSTQNLRPLKALVPLIPPPPSTSTTSTSPIKPLLSTSITSRALFLLPKPISEDEEEEVEEMVIEGGRKLLDWRPPSPSKILALKVQDESGMGGLIGEGGILESWSPRKKRRNGYVLDGLASLAKATLDSASTSHSLWLHEISRTLALATTASISTGNKISKVKLRKILKPDIRLVILEVLRLGDGSSGGREIGYWEESKTVLARCRILIDGQEEEKSTTSEVEDGPDTQGLVLFSLHSNPSTTSIDPKILLQQTQALSQSTSPSKSKSHPNNTTTLIEKNSNLIIPTNAHDLRIILKGIEIWCFEPWHEIILPSDVDQVIVHSEVEEVEEKMEVEEEKEVEGDVFWDPRPAKVVQLERERKMVELKQKEKEEERVKKALICSRFGIVV